MKYIKILIALLLIIKCFFVTAQTDCESYGYPFWNEPDELMRGRLEKEKALYGNPYTLMNRVDYPIADDGFIAIRKAIISDPTKTNIADLYTQLVGSAHTARPPAGGGEEHPVSELAAWTKYNAFVLLIGLDSVGNPLNTTPYLANIYAGFEHMNYEGSHDDGKVIRFANSVMCWIQAYDLYKTYKRVTTEFHDNLETKWQFKVTYSKLFNYLRSFQKSPFNKGYSDKCLIFHTTRATI